MNSFAIFSPSSRGISLFFAKVAEFLREIPTDKQLHERDMEELEIIPELTAELVS